MIPLDLYFARRKHSPRVAARIAKLNPLGIEEGSFVRGWRPHARYAQITRDIATPGMIDKRYGCGTWRQIPREALVKISGKRKGITGLWLLQHSNELRA